MSALARSLARTAFGPGALAYALLTGHRAWRDDSRSMAALVTGPRVLDLGVGPGTSALEMARAAPGHRHVGLDRSREMLALAARAARRARLDLPLVQADALALPFRGGALDGVTGHSVLYLLPDPLGALREVRRALRPGGAVAFIEPRAGPRAFAAALAGGPRCAVSMLLWEAMARLHRRFDERSLPALLRAAGLAEARAWPVLFGYGVMGTARAP